MGMSSELPEGFKEKFENMVVTAMARECIPGLSIALVKDGRIIYARGFGARNLKENLPATPHTLYGIGSCTKSFTALAVMQLVEQGKLDVQDPVKNYLPFKLGSDEKPIRIHHLLTHSSGIPNLGTAEIWFDRVMGRDETGIPLSSWDDIFLHVNGAQEEIAAEPGKRYFYLNIGFDLLGQIVERVSKMPYEEYVKEKILKPLKMNRTTFLEEDYEKYPDVMTAYLKEHKEEKIKLTPSKYYFTYDHADGGLLSSVMELTNYLLANINGGVFEGTRILDATLMEEMHKIHIETEISRRGYGRYGKTGYGYGWAIMEDFLGHKLVRHGGSIGVSSANLMFIPDLKIGVALGANVDDHPEQLLRSALAALMGKDPEKEIPYFQIEKKLNMLAGEYATYKGINKVSIEKKGGMLYLEYKRWDMELRAPLIPETEKLENYKFYIISGPGSKTPVEFTADPSGKIDLYVERDRLHKIGGKTSISE